MQGSFAGRVSPFANKALRQAVESLPTIIYRAKGIIFLHESPDRRGVFQLVGQRMRVSVSMLVNANPE